MKKYLRHVFFVLLITLIIIPLFFTTNARAVSVGSSAECMVLMESGSGRVLYEKNAHKQRYMASTTKILTAITVIENTADLDKICVIPDAAVGVEGSSIYLEKGEELSVKDLLYGLMLQSGNDCAEALAILTSKTKENFADLMNKTAKKIGAENSNFVTPHGLHDDNHYTTAYDLALISSYALKNPTFAEIAKTKKHTTTWKGRNYQRVIINKNRLLNSFDGCDGVKTGFTKKAGRCYVSSATRNNMQVVCVVLNCGPMFEECAGLMNRAFNEYEMTQLTFKGEKLCDAPVKKSKKETVAAGCINDKFYPLSKTEREGLSVEATITKELKAPVKSGTEVGKVLIKVKNNLLFEEKLYTIEKAEPKSILDMLKEIAFDSSSANSYKVTKDFEN